MTRTIFILIFPLLIISILSCNRQSCDSKLAAADSLMFISPEKSLSILESISEIEKYGKKERAYYALLLSQAKSRNHITPENDSLIRIAINYYSKNDDSYKRAWCYVVASDVYDVLGNDSLAIMYAREAERESKSIDDLRLRYYSNYFLGYMLHHKKPYNESNLYLNEAIKYATELGDTLHIISSLDNLGTNALYESRYEVALAYYQQALSYCISKKWNKYLAHFYSCIAIAAQQKNDYGYALNNINKSIDACHLFDSHIDSCSLYQFKSNILAGLGMWDSIPYYAKKGLSDSSFVTRGMYDATMIKWAEGKKDYKRAIDYYRHYAAMLDSIHKEEMEDNVMEMHKKYDLTQATIERDRLYMKNQRLVLIVLGLFVICFGALIVVLLYRRRIKELQRQREEAKAELTHNTLKMMNERNRRLIADERRRHRLLALTDVIAKVMSTGRHDDAEQLKRHKDMALTNDETARLIEAVDVCYEGYLTRLQDEHPALGQNDLALCCMILLKVTNRDIAILFGLSSDTLKKRKLRLRTEKLCITDVLEEWLERDSRTYVDEIDAEYATPEETPDDKETPDVATVTGSDAAATDAGASPDSDTPPSAQ